MSESKYHKYYKSRHAHPENFNCDCGAPADLIKHNEPICKRCNEITHRLQRDFHPDIADHKVLKCSDPSAMRPARRRAFEIGAFDPEFFGRRVVT